MNRFTDDLLYQTVACLSIDEGWLWSIFVPSLQSRPILFESPNSLQRDRKSNRSLNFKDEAGFYERIRVLRQVFTKEFEFWSRWSPHCYEGLFEETHKPWETRHSEDIGEDEDIVLFTSTVSFVASKASSEKRHSNTKVVLFLLSLSLSLSWIICVVFAQIQGKEAFAGIFSYRSSCNFLTVSHSSYSVNNTHCGISFQLFKQSIL